MCKGVYGLVPYSEQWRMRTLLYVLFPALHMLIAAVSWIQSFGCWLVTQWSLW